MGRTFEARPAKREATPIMIGLMGPSGSGKTKSALRLATGIQRVIPGEIFFIDSESRRALHYADSYKFQHVPFGAPFGSLDYLDVITYCVEHGATTIIVDSMSHEHEGPGGVLEQHTAETKRLAALWKKSESAAQMAAWSKPKQDRRLMINGILQKPVNFIFCFRAKEKLKIVPGKDPVPLGYKPLAGEEFVYEMTLNCLLYPGSRGTPVWDSAEIGEREMIKLPEQFMGIFKDSPQLTEDIGQALAEWSAGVKPVRFDAVDLLLRYGSCGDSATLRGLEVERAAAWKKLDTETKGKLKAAKESAEKRIAEANAAPAEPPAPADPDADLKAEALERERAELAAEKK